MKTRLTAPLWAAIAFSLIVCTERHAAATMNDTASLIKEGNALLEQKRLHDAAQAFQKAVDLDPSSPRAHEQLGVTLSIEIMSGNTRPSADSDILERAEDHLKRAIELAPSAPKPLSALSELEAFVAERSADFSERTERYKKAQDLLKQAVSLEPGSAETYLRLANVERDEFGPVLQAAKARDNANPGPLSDASVRHSLQQRYSALIEDAIANAQKASEMNANSPRPLLLISRLFKERALLRNTPEEYASDMRSAADWQRQFLAVGGHLDSTEMGASH